MKISITITKEWFMQTNCCRMAMMFLSALVLMTPFPAMAQPPALINYQGRLVDGTNLVSGNVGLSLRLVDDATGGTVLYEDSNTVAVVDGLYATLIGDDTTAGSLNAALAVTNVWLEVAVDNVALTPRERIASVAYALVAEQAASITGPVSDNQLSVNIARLDGTNQTFTGPVTFSSTSNQFTGNFSGDAYHLTNVDLAAITASRSPVVAWGNNSSGQTTVPESATNLTALASFGFHNLALRADGSVMIWGNNAENVMNPPETATGVVAIAAGLVHNVVLRSDGTVVAWGYNNFGETNVPANATGVVAIAAGGYHSLALRNDGTVVAWGDNTYNQIDVPATATGVVAVAAGEFHSLAVREDGAVIVWGIDAYNLTNVPVTATGVVAIVSGFVHILALRADGTVVAWGSSFLGRIDIPEAATGIVAIAAGGSHSMALRDDGVVLAWGGNAAGQTNVPAASMGAVAIAAGYEHSMVLRTDRAPAEAALMDRDNTFRGTVSATTFVAGSGGMTSVGRITLTPPNGASALSIVGNRAGGFGDSIASIANTNTGSASPALRLVGRGSNTSDNGVLSVSAEGTGRIARFGNASTWVVTIGNTGDISAQSFTGDGSLLSNLNASAIASGELSEAQLSTNVARLNAGTYPDARLSANIPRLDSGTYPDARLSTNIVRLNASPAFSGIVSFNSAMGSFSGSGAGLTGLSASALASGTIADARLSTNVARLSGSVQTFADPVLLSSALGTFFGNGAGLTNLASANLTGTISDALLSANVARLNSGTYPDARLSTNIARLNATQTFSARQNIVTAPSTRALEVIGDRTGNINSSLVYMENTNRASSSPTLRLLGWSTNANDDAVLNVSANGAGRIARFGNSNNWVVVIDNAGNVGGLTFTPSSDRNVKENFAPVDAAEILEKVVALPISRWNYQADATTPHIGPMAQDFHAAFGVGPDDTRIATVDADGVALAAIQALAREKERLEEKVSGFGVQVSELEEENRVLRERLEVLEKKLGL